MGGQKSWQVKTTLKLKLENASLVTQQQWRKHEQECSLLIRDVTQQGQQQTE
jgi:hypothetical protein